MSRGGARDNAGRKSGWVNLETKLIRVPVAIESQLMAIAKKLDRVESIELKTKSLEIESVTQSNSDSVTDSISIDFVSNSIDSPRSSFLAIAIN